VRLFSHFDKSFERLFLKKKEKKIYIYIYMYSLVRIMNPPHD
jgi:hypothetical protein